MKLTVQDLTRVALFAALTAVFSYIVVPLPPVPVSAQTLAVMLAGTLLGSRNGALSQVLYVLLGSIGLPIFAGGSAGLGVLFGPTGGYLWGFIIGAYVIGKIIEKTSGTIYWKVFALIIGGIGIIYFFGVLQLMIVTGMTLFQALSAGMLPFLPGDILKVIVAALLAKKNFLK